MTDKNKEILNSPIWRVVNALFLLIIGIIGWVYMNGQEVATKDRKSIREDVKTITADQIRIQAEFHSFRDYNQRILEDIQLDVEKLNSKIDRLLEK